MSHNIGEMFYFGEVPWHGLGRRLTRPADWEEALRAGGLDWEVELVPLATGESPPSTVPREVGVVRKDRPSSDPTSLIGVVHPDFRPLQNRIGAQLFDSLFGRGKRVYHTGGYLNNGEVVWLLAKLPGQIKVRGQDVVDTYLLFTNSHDGSIAIDFRLTTVRVVCNNTLSFALSDDVKGKVFRHAHDGDFARLKAGATAFLEGAMAQIREAQALFNRLAERECAKQDFDEFLEALLPDPVPTASAIYDRAVRGASEKRRTFPEASRRGISRVWSNGLPALRIPRGEPSWWGALNAVTAWVDHAQEVKGDRYAHNLLGAGDRLKSRALREIQRRLQDASRDNERYQYALPELPDRDLIASLERAIGYLRNRASHAEIIESEATGAAPGFRRKMTAASRR